MNTQWKWKLVGDLKDCKKNFCSTTAAKDLENTGLKLKHDLCKYSLISGLEGSVSNRKAWVKKGTTEQHNRIKFGIIYINWTLTGQWGAFAGADEAAKGAFKATLFKSGAGAW